MSAEQDFKFRSDMTVELVRSMADDSYVVQAAKVSTKAGASLEENKPTFGFINYLAKNRHGSPFEHAVFTFYVEAPIFVWREIMRHRVASYNEESGRYKQLKPVFYVPDIHRPLQQVGKPGHYTFEPGTSFQIAATETHLAEADVQAYRRYEYLLELGVAREVARMALPLNIYSSAYVTMNARALTNFLSLRTKDDSSTFPSYPQNEIEQVARLMEHHFEAEMPMTYQAWAKAGRVGL